MMPRYRLVTTFHTSGAFTEFTADNDGEAAVMASDMVDSGGHERILVLEEVTGNHTTRTVFEKPTTTNYTVTWSIDVDTETPEQAAIEAHITMLDPDSMATIFVVTHDENEFPGERISVTVDLLQGTVTPTDTFGEPCDRCGTPIPSNRDRSPNYCEPCAVVVTAQGGDED